MTNGYHQCQTFLTTKTIRVGPMLTILTLRISNCTILVITTVGQMIRPTCVSALLGWIEDVAQNNSKIDYAWNCVHVHGIDEVRKLDFDHDPYDVGEIWEYDGFDSENDQALWTQTVHNYTSPSCIDFDRTIKHYNLWQAQPEP
jgi:hypothetical protein